MADRRRLALVLAGALVLVLAGCGVSTSNPVDLGDGLAPPALGAGAAAGPPGPNEARSPVDQVTSYLKADVEYGKPLDRVKSFLTSRAWAALGVDGSNPPSPTVIRLIGPPASVAADPSRLNILVRYQVIGVLNEQGRVDDLSDPTVKNMTFELTPAEENSRFIRIDAIAGAPSSLMISDDALNLYYQVQPVYFWDATNSQLVPDVRYVPLGLARDARAGRIVQWLVDGPSAWLGGALRLPASTAVKPSVQLRDGVFVVNLTAPAALGGEVAIARLYHQLQWSLQDSTNPAQVTLEIEDKVQAVKGSPTDYLKLNQSYAIAPRGPKYDIVDGKVVQFVATPTVPAVLGARENQGVTYAALNRTATMAALVKNGPDGHNKSVQLVRPGASTLTVDFPAKSADAGRPVWATSDHVLVPYAGHLYSVSSADGGAVDVTPGRVGHVRSVSLSPDGRRVALVADGQGYVTSLNISDGGALAIGPNPRTLLAGLINAVAVAWESESRLLVAGTASVPGEAAGPAMWEVTADSVVANNQSTVLGGVVAPSDVVAFPTAPFYYGPEVYMYAGGAVYPFLSQLSQLTQDPKLKAPFFGGE